MRGLKITEKITKRDSKSLNIFFEEISKNPILSDKFQKILLEKSKKGCKESENLLFNSNLRFVVSVAKQYHFEGFLLVDLIQEGSKGLLKAIKKGEVREENAFLSYAVWWIRHSILDYITKRKGIVRTPLNKILTTNRINKAKEKFFAQFGRDPTDEEIFKITEENPEDYFEKRERSLSETLYEDSEDKTLEDNLKSEEEDFFREEDFKIIVNKVLQYLTEKERETLSLYYGIGKPRQYSLTEIANKYDLTRERIRQIKERAERRLKSIWKKMNLDKL